MEQNFLSRTYLETLSTADLISLADDYGIDIPDDLNRRFIIGELLEFADELANENKKDSDMEEGNSALEKISELPSTFNETQIGIVLRNLIWAFVYWDIKEADIKKLENSEKFKNLVLRVSYFESEEATVPEESFDIQISKQIREQYVMLNPGKKFVRIDLVACFEKNVTDNLAVSKKIALPEGSDLLGSALPGRDIDFDPVLELSGIKSVLKSHYETHRELFSN